MVVFKARLYISVWAFVFAPITLSLWPFHFHFPMSAISHSFHFHFPISPFSSSIQLAFPFLVSVSQLSARWQLCSSSFRHSGSCWHCTARGYRHCIQIYKYTDTNTQIHKYTNTQIQIHLSLHIVKYQNHPITPARLVPTVCNDYALHPSRSPHTMV